MDRPDPVADALGSESVTAAVELGGGDAVYVTPTRALVYRSEGLLRDESVESYSLDADRVELAERRSKATVRLQNPETTAEFTVPESATDEVLEALFTGVLRYAGRIEEGERVRAVYRFSELTLLVTDARLLRHVGDAVWSDDHEGYPFADATGLDYEEGTHATQLVLTVDGRPRRLKLPAERAGAVRRTVERALFEFHGVDSLAAFEAAVAPDEDGDAAAGRPDAETDDSAGGDARSDGAASSETDPGDVPPSLDLDLGGDDQGSGGPDDATAPSVAPTDDEGVEDRLAALESAVERQAALLERQQDTLERLVEELRRGR